MDYLPEKIISGGQTAADIGGLVGAKRVNIPTEGTAPRDFKTEKGLQPEALKSFGLVMHPSGNYKDRTLVNVQSSDATLVFALYPDSNGTRLTIDFCQQENKLYLVITEFDMQSLAETKKFLEHYRPAVLNIAGNRESVAPGLAVKVADFIENLFKQAT